MHVHVAICSSIHTQIYGFAYDAQDRPLQYLMTTPMMYVCPAPKSLNHGKSQSVTQAVVSFGCCNLRKKSIFVEPRLRYLVFCHIEAQATLPT